jgi:hypothetical protein
MQFNPAPVPSWAVEMGDNYQDSHRGLPQFGTLALPSHKEDVFKDTCLKVALLPTLGSARCHLLRLMDSNIDLTATKNYQQNRSNRFLNLPTEVRHKIYEHIFDEQWQYITRHDLANDQAKEPIHLRPVAARYLLLTSRFINHEIQPFLTRLKSDIRVDLSDFAQNNPNGWEPTTLEQRSRITTAVLDPSILKHTNLKCFIPDLPRLEKVVVDFGPIKPTWDHKYGLLDTVCIIADRLKMRPEAQAVTDPIAIGYVFWEDHCEFVEVNVDHMKVTFRELEDSEEDIVDVVGIVLLSDDHN